MSVETTANLPKDALVVVYCDGIGCNASTKGALKMLLLGFQVKELIGGLDWWGAGTGMTFMPGPPPGIPLRVVVRRLPTDTPSQRPLAALAPRWPVRPQGTPTPFALWQPRAFKPTALSHRSRGRSGSRITGAPIGTRGCASGT